MFRYKPEYYLRKLEAKGWTFDEIQNTHSRFATQKDVPAKLRSYSRRDGEDKCPV